MLYCLLSYIIDVVNIGDAILLYDDVCLALVRDVRMFFLMLDVDDAMFGCCE